MHVEIRTLSGVFEGILIHTLYLRVFHAGNVAQSPDAEFADNMRRVDQSTQQAVHDETGKHKLAIFRKGLSGWY